MLFFDGKSFQIKWMNWSMFMQLKTLKDVGGPIGSPARPNSFILTYIFAKEQPVYQAKHSPHENYFC